MDLGYKIIDVVGRENITVELCYPRYLPSLWMVSFAIFVVEKIGVWQRVASFFRRVS
jgi:hypothetical protein